MLDKKQNVFDDFIAAAEYCIERGLHRRASTSPSRAASTAACSMGAMITQRPDLFRAVVCQVPLLDMLRYQNFQIAKLWIPEYGIIRRSRSSSSGSTPTRPYHHVKPGTEYPAVLFMTADTDTRVDPMHAKKMAALMQAEAKNGASRRARSY